MVESLSGSRFASPCSVRAACDGESGVLRVLMGEGSASRARRRIAKRISGCSARHSLLHSISGGAHSDGFAGLMGA